MSPTDLVMQLRGLSAADAADWINGQFNYSISPEARRNGRVAKRYSSRPEVVSTLLSAIRKNHPDAVVAHEYDYEDENGLLVLVILRFKWSGGKTFRPIHPVGNTWCIGDPDGPLPLSRLPELLASTDGLVLVVEGEFERRHVRC